MAVTRVGGGALHLRVPVTAGDVAVSSQRLEDWQGELCQLVMKGHHETPVSLGKRLALSPWFSSFIESNEPCGSEACR